jgi:LysM repeat protein
MTRETKIGLLVGLAFIIVIGILLSDHLTSATEPPQAQLAQVGNNVRSSTAAPGANRNNQPAIFDNNPSPQATAPTHAVPTQSEVVNRGAPPVQIINVGGPANGGTTSLQATSQPPVSMAPPINNTQENAPIVVETPQNNPPANPVVRQDPPANDPINQIARQHGEELVNLNGTPMNNAPQPLTTGTTSYVAQPGDSVSRLASKFLGANNKVNREAIINANPSLKSDANKIIIGKSYVIPTKPEGKPEASTSNAPRAAAPSADHWYTVQTGDSLWKIATAQCGDAKAVAAIKELNKDIIKNDTVQVGQKIRLPNAPK